MTLIPVHGLLSIFGEAATLERGGMITRNGFGEAAQTPTLTPITVMTHPLDAAELERIGLDYEHAHRVFATDTPLVLGGGATNPDVIVYDGQRWELQAIEDYQTHGGLDGSVARLIE